MEFGWGRHSSAAVGKWCIHSTTHHNKYITLEWLILTYMQRLRLFSLLSRKNSAQLTVRAHGSPSKLGEILASINIYLNTFRKVFVAFLKESLKSIWHTKGAHYHP